MGAGGNMGDGQVGRWKVQAMLMVVQLTYGIGNILNKTALNNGINKIVFSLYRDGVALAVLGPLAYFFERDVRPTITLRLFLLLILLGFTGIFGAQLLILTGLRLTSAAFVAIMINAVPVVAFCISVLFRLEHIRLKRRDGQAKLTGILSCISGALFMAIYKGPAILRGIPSIPLHQQTPMHLDSISAPETLHLNIDSWQLGALCLVANSLCLAIYINLQAPILSLYPAPVSVTFFAYLFGAVMLATFGTWTIQQPSLWMMNEWMDILAFVYAGIVPSALNFALQTICVQQVGPFLVIAYLPVQAVATAVLSWIFLAETLYLGHIVGALLIFAGLYLVIWGQAKHQQLEADTPNIVLITNDQPVIEPRSSIEEALLG